MKKVFIFIFTLFLALSASAQNSDAFPSLTSNDSKITVELYPNPAIEYLNIQIEGTDAEMSFHLHNIIGNEIRIAPEKQGDNKYRINVESLSPGYYLLMVKDPESKFTRTIKFLKR